MKKIDFSNLPYHILFTGLYPVLFLWLFNVHQIPAFAIPTSLWLALALTAIVFILSLVIIRRLIKAGLVTTLFLFFFFSYGHLFSLLDSAGTFGHQLARHRITVPLWVILFIVLMIFILRSRSDLKSVNIILNVVTGFLVLSTVFN